jgi:hypothetical protein
MAVRTRLAAGALALLAAACLLYAYYDRFWYPPDEGNYAHVAQRLLEGETLNLQIQDVHPGYISFINAAALRLFGPDLVSLRYPLVAAGVLQAIVLFLLFPASAPWRAATAAVALTSLGAIQFLNPTAHWYCLALVIALVATLASPSRTSARLIAAGVLIGTIILFRQLTGFLVGLGTMTFLLWQAGEGGGRGRNALFGKIIAATMAVALAAYLAAATDVSGVVLFGVWPVALLALLVSRPQASNHEVLRLAGAVITGIVIASVPLMTYLLWHGSVRAWMADVGPTAVALTRLDFFDRTNFGALVVRGLVQTLSSRDLPSVLNGLYWASLPLVAAVNGAIVLRRLWLNPAVAVAPLPIVAVFYAVVSVHFQIPVYLYYSAGLTLASLLWIAPSVSPFAGRLSMAAALFLAAVGVYFHAGQPSTRGLAGLLKGERVAVARAPLLPHSSLRIDPAEGQRYEALVALIRREVPAGDAIFAVPSNAELYFLSDRRNEFRFYNTALGVRDDAALEAVERTLREHPPRLVTFNRDDKYNTPRSLQIMEAVRQRYVLVGRVDPFDVYVLP